MYQKQINNITIASNINDINSFDELIKDYKKLNEKCDKIISKIKERKQKNKGELDV